MIKNSRKEYSIQYKATHKKETSTYQKKYYITHKQNWIKHYAKIDRLCKESQSFKKNYLEKRNKYQKERRHKLGIHKKYIHEMGVSYTRPYRKMHEIKRKNLEIYSGEISIKTIQRVYEDNIKKYGTLTCYLCYKPIEFKQDSIEHKTPLSRGGNNDYDNLAIAHKICNSRKNIKTEAEYRNWAKNGNNNEW